MPETELRIVTHFMPRGGGDADLLADLERVVSRRVAVVYPARLLSPLTEKFKSDQTLQVSLNQNIAEIRREFDALKSLDELGLLPRTHSDTEERYVNSERLLNLRNPTIQKAYENLFRCSLNVLAISDVYEQRTGEALPISTATSSYGAP